jgi:PhoPQ-activated pathogenicity-related protein
MRALTGWLIALVAASLLVQAPAWAAETALDRYVARPDSVYSWKLNSTIDGPGYKAYVLELTSQTWRTTKDVDRPVWTHWLTVIKPDEVTSDKALLYITGGDNGDPPPTRASQRSAAIALATHSVVAELGMVPNQPLRFTDSPGVAREEDDLIAYTQVKHGVTHDDEWLVRLAMVKSGVRAMDAVQAFLASDAGGKLAIKGFVVAGGSKRGWTTWLVGAVDPRVVAIMPLVIDVLNTEPVTRHQFEALGYFTPALEDYVNHGLIPHGIGTPELASILKIEDPYLYRDRARMKIPKYVINASGDQYFLPDNSSFYYPGLPEEKRLRYVPNADHSLAGSDVVESLIAFYQAILSGTPRPAYSWTKGRDGALMVRSATKPREVRLWQAVNPAARDFRVETLGKVWTSTVLTPTANGTFVGWVARPAKGYAAFFVELTYDSGGAYPFKFTTEVSVIPDVLNFRWADAAKKYPQTAATPAAKP